MYIYPSDNMYKYLQIYKKNIFVSIKNIFVKNIFVIFKKKIQGADNDTVAFVLKETSALKCLLTMSFIQCSAVSADGMCVAVCCSVLQYITVCCTVLQRAEMSPCNGFHSM